MPTTNINGNQITINVNDTVPPENFATIDSGSLIGTVYTKAQDNEWREEVEAAVTTSIKGVAKPDDVITTTGFYRMLANTADTYTNYLDLNDEPIVVTDADLNIVSGVQRNEVIFEITNGVTEKRVYAKVGNDGANGTATIPEWAAGSYSPDAMVIYDFVQYITPTGATATDVPSEDSLVWKQIGGKVDLDIDGGALSFDVGKGNLPIPTGVTPIWVQKTPTLLDGYYTYNNGSNSVSEVYGVGFKRASFTALSGQRIRVKIGQFYIQNNSNGINPICIHIKNSTGSIIYYSKGMAETGIPEPSTGLDATTGTFQFEKDITVDSTIYVCGDYSAIPILEMYVRENVTGPNRFIVNTSMADQAGGYVSFDNYQPGAANPYKNKEQAILGDSLSEDPPSGQTPTTSKYWYTFLEEKLELNFKTYAVSGNTWSDMYNQALQAKSDLVAGTHFFHLFTLFGGTNDFYFNVPIGEFYTTSGGVRTLNLDPSTFKGRINRLINYIKRNFPTTPIRMFNILHRGAAQGTPGELTANGIGVFLDEYSKAIDDAGKLWAVPVIDVRGESGLYPVIPEALQFYTSSNDYLHLSPLGHEKLADYYMAKLLGLPI
ncbi:SGNH/GDSL hydrolase family protein [Chryseobacterium aquaticum]|nr:SGNH/GDSL hydrolase family protein [Chryseobacterium aquaticum]